MTAALAGDRFTRTLQLWAVLPTFYSATQNPDADPAAETFIRRTPQNATFGAACNGNLVRVLAQGFTTIAPVFVGPDDRPLTIGTYELPDPPVFGTRPPPGTANVIGVGCRGRLVIHDIAVTTDRVQRFWASLDLRQCGGGRVFVDVRVTDPPLPEGDVFSGSCTPTP